MSMTWAYSSVMSLKGNEIDVGVFDQAGCRLRASPYRREVG
ncbi:hypothetical protein HMPREF9153_2262 [Cutibacterium avidum ATCC 25577]|uniref:Uncharacterized protein n=1 Tax=Cutibacterium avidum ATCC 25577 TaxID=997355 RepID=G4CYR1_9ACTN|nr:hypothetical protein HMPREF9153_2262 [Cutibacterium avidum ATCC 25577]